MKKIVVLFLVLSLILVVTGSVSAKAARLMGYFATDFENPYLMAYNLSGKLASFEGWYTIEKDAPSIKVYGVFQDYLKTYALKAFKNDQTFAELKLLDNSDEQRTYFKGSYLFDFNLFVGLEYYSYESHDEDYDEDVAQFILSPGYRFNLGENGYVALGLDYAMNNDWYEDNGIIDYEIKGCYYFDKAKLYGQVIRANDDVAGDKDDLYLRLGGTYQVTENVVLGARFADWKDYRRMYEIGCTAAFDKFGAELSFINIKREEQEAKYEIHTNLLYSFTDKIRAGMELVKIEDVDTVMIAKAKYTLDDKKSITFIHEIPTDGDMSTYAVTYLGLDYKF